MASITWLAAGIGLLSCSETHRARPAFLTGLGLLLGGAVLGLGSTAFAAHGGYPIVALIFAAAVTWALQSDDEADGLQRGDRLLPALVLGALAFVLHALGSLLGVQPTLVIGLVLRPFDLPVAAGLFFLWFRGRSRGREHVWDSGSRPMRELVWTVAGATVAGLLGGDLGQVVRFGLLALAPARLLAHLFRGEAREMARITAVAAASSLAFGLLMRTGSLEDAQTRQLAVVDAAAALDVHHARSQIAVDMALQTTASEEPQHLYDRHQENLARAVDHLGAAVAASGRSDVVIALHDLRNVLATHHRWCRRALQALSVHSAAWGDPQARERADGRARSAHQESRLAYERGLLALQATRRAATNGMREVTAAIGRARSTTLALIVALALVTIGLLAKGANPVLARRDAARSAPLRGRVLIVDESSARRSVVQDVLADTGADLAMADSGTAALALLEGQDFDLILLDMLLPDFDGYATAARLRERTPSLPIVALSGERGRSLDAGCAAHLDSPLHPDALRAVFARHLARG